MSLSSLHFEQPAGQVPGLDSTLPKEQFWAMPTMGLGDDMNFVPAVDFDSVLSTGNVTGHGSKSTATPCDLPMAYWTDEALHAYLDVMAV